jgi:hypothetical protein
MKNYSYYQKNDNYFQKNDNYFHLNLNDVMSENDENDENASGWDTAKG